MKTLVLKANDRIVERITLLCDLFPHDQYDLTVLSEDSAPTVLESPLPLSLKRGAAKEIVTYIAEDFEEPLDDFQEYMS